MDTVTAVILDSETYAEAHEKLCQSYREFRSLRERVHGIKCKYRYPTDEDAFQHIRKHWKERQDRANMQPWQKVRSHKASGYMPKRQDWAIPQVSAAPVLTPEQEVIQREHHEMIEKENLANLRKRIKGEFND